MQLKSILATIATFTTTSAMAHDISTPHAHTGGMVFIQLPQAAIVLLGALALLGLAVFTANKFGKGNKK